MAMSSFLVGLSCCAGRPRMGAEEEDVFPAGAPAAPEDPGVAAVVEAAAALLPGGRLSDFQRAWCTPAVVSIYLRGRKGQVHAAAEILAQSLAWRAEFQDILTGARLPDWQSDFRVLTRCESGHPVLYLCYRHHVPPSNVRAIIEHGARVLETAVLSLRGGAQQFDVLVDCHGFSAVHLDCRSLVGIMHMIQQPFRDRLRTATLVGAPMAFGVVWGFLSPLLKGETRKKMRFATPEEVVAHLRQAGGPAAARDVENVFAENRRGVDCRPGEVDGRRMPSELHDADGVASPSEEGPLLRRFATAFSGFSARGADIGSASSGGASSGVAAIGGTATLGAAFGDAATRRGLAARDAASGLERHAAPRGGPRGAPAGAPVGAPARAAAAGRARPGAGWCCRRRHSAGKGHAMAEALRQLRQVFAMTT